MKHTFKEAFQRYEKLVIYRELLNDSIDNTKRQVVK
jgi:hypothetical protein